MRRKLLSQRALLSKRTHSEQYHNLDRTRSHSPERNHTTIIMPIIRMSTITTMCSRRSTLWVPSAPCHFRHKCSSRSPKR